MINMFIMVVVETYEVLANESHGLSEKLVPTFKEAWSRKDPQVSSN